MPPVGPPPTLNSIADKLAKFELLQGVVNDLGSWASAAQDDPGCRKELKANFLRLLDLRDYPVEEGVMGIQGGCPCPAGEPGITTALDVLRKLNSILPLGDLCYYVREREGQGWEGPQIVAWGIACAQMEQLFKKAEAQAQREYAVQGHQHVYTEPAPPEDVVKAFGSITVPQPWPKDWPPYHHRNEPCDMKVGPCSCGAWHVVSEFTL